MFQLEWQFRERADSNSASFPCFDQLCFYPFYFIFLKDFIYLFLKRGEGREQERERNISVWLPFVRPPLGTWRATQAFVLTGNPTGDPLVHRLELNPLSYTSQGISILYCILWFCKRFYFEEIGFTDTKFENRCFGIYLTIPLLLVWGVCACVCVYMIFLGGNCKYCC